MLTANPKPARTQVKNATFTALRLHRHTLFWSLAMSPTHFSIRATVVPITIATIVLISFTGLATAQNPNANKSFDEKLFRLAEILGAVHYLRELCEADEGTLWRQQMKDLLESEGATSLRKAQLTRSFNNGYRSYSRTYVNCTPSARSAITRFLTEGVEITDTLVKPARPAP
jgi:uncharacterized protein (TIGR02301 family)